MFDTPELAAFRAEVRRFVTTEFAGRHPPDRAGGAPVSREQFMRWHGFAGRTALAGAALARSLRRPRLAGGTAHDLRRGDVHPRRAGTQRHHLRHDRPGADPLRQPGPAGRFLPAIASGAVVVPGYSSRIRAPTWRRSRRARCVAATATWSTARRSGPPARSTPTGCSARCAPTRRPRRRRASPPPDRRRRRASRCGRSAAFMAGRFSTRCFSRRSRCPSRTPVGTEHRGLDHRQVVARIRAPQTGTGGREQAPHGAGARTGLARDGERRAADEAAVVPRASPSCACA